MRVVDKTTSRNFLQYLYSARGEYAKTNEQIASGNRFEKLSDDVSAGTMVMRSRMERAKAEQQLSNVESIYDELATTESSLMNVGDILNDIQTSVIKGMSETVGQDGRDVIATEIGVMREEIIQFLNVRYGDKFVFGGANSSDDPPFVAGDDGRLNYNGIPVDDILRDNDGYYYLDTAGDRQNIPMEDQVYMDIGLGIRMTGSEVDYTSAFQISSSGLDALGFGVDAETGFSNNIYNILVDIEDALVNYDRDKLSELDLHFTGEVDKFRRNITDIGAKTNLLETMKTQLTSQIDNDTSRIYNLMGTDDAEAATRQTLNDYILKAVLQMGADIMPVSLMDFLR